ncbi:hypothetical protein INT47_008684, partial [Mucor saturninus]
NDLSHTASSSSVTHHNSVESLLSSQTSRPRLTRSRTSGVGTRTYAAPEQIAIPTLAYDEKADIYSLGIILFELYRPFSTAMERADAIDKLKRKGQFPAHFVEKYPTQSQIILSMMNKDPCLRPTALEILSSDLFKKRYIVPDNNTVVHDREMAELRDQYTQM